MHTHSSYERYSRQINLPAFGEAGQQKLLQAKLLVVGAGGLGCAALQYLAAAGVGSLGIIDHDRVALHNLHRQVLYTMQDIGQPKAATAAAALQKQNPGIALTPINEQLTVHNALECLEAYDIIIDGSDNFPTRYLVNDACALLQKPLIYGAVSSFEGQLAIFNCRVNGQPAVNYRHLFPRPPGPGTIANCAEAGVLGVLPGIIGCMQASEAIKLITGIGQPLVNKLLTYNALNNQVYELDIQPHEPASASMPASTAAFREMDYGVFCGINPGTPELDALQFKALRLTGNALIIDVRNAGEAPGVNEFEHLQIPLERLEANVPPTEKDSIIVFCQTGSRSRQAAALLAAKWGGSKKIFSLAGGILQWKKQLQES